MKVNKKNKKRFVKNKQNKQNTQDKERKKRNEGFSIVETLFSLLLVSLAIMLIAEIMVSAMDTDKKSDLRFNMLQKIEYCKNQLVSKSFEDPQLIAGSYTDEDRRFKMKWEITDISPTLKVIDFSISYKSLTRQAYFYKSRYIKNIFSLPEEVKSA